MGAQDSSTHGKALWEHAQGRPGSDQSGAGRSLHSAQGSQPLGTAAPPARWAANLPEGTDHSPQPSRGSLPRSAVNSSAGCLLTRPLPEGAPQKTLGVGVGGCPGPAGLSLRKGVLAARIPGGGWRAGDSPMLAPPAPTPRSPRLRRAVRAPQRPGRQAHRRGEHPRARHADGAGPASEPSRAPGPAGPRPEPRRSVCHRARLRGSPLCLSRGLGLAITSCVLRVATPAPRGQPLRSPSRSW